MFAVTDTEQVVDRTSSSTRDRSATDISKALDSSDKPNALQNQRGDGEKIGLYCYDTQYVP